MKKLLSAGVMLAACPTLSYAVEVYPGCAAAPGPQPGHHTFYVDPVHGSDKGNGSAGQPWKDLGSVIGMNNKLLASKAWSNKTSSYNDVNPSGPVKAGDVVMLMSGNYGPLKTLNSFNTDFVWVMAAPNQTPIITTLAIVSSAKFAFQGIKFQAGTPTVLTSANAKAVDGQIDVGGGDYTGVTNNIVFYDNTFSTADDSSKWSDWDWIAKPFFTTFSAHATCTSAVQNKFLNIFNGAILSYPKTLFKSNSIDHFTNDGIDVSNGEVTISGNTITNNMSNTLNGYHPDGIQGWSNVVNGVAATNVNVTIEGNTIVKWERPGSYLQGISIFDGHWNNLVVQNNVVVSDTTDGISLFGTTNSKVINNTLVAAGTTQPMLWIYPGKDGTPSNNVVVRNNIAPILAVAGTGTAVAGPGIIYDHNIFTSKLIGTESGKVVTLTTTGQPSTSTTFVSVASSLFVKLANAPNIPDLHLKPGSAAIGAGSTASAPATDITGTARAAPIDIGAYAAASHGGGVASGAGSASGAGGG